MLYFLYLRAPTLSPLFSVSSKMGVGWVPLCHSDRRPASFAGRSGGIAARCEIRPPKPNNGLAAASSTSHESPVTFRPSHCIAVPQVPQSPSRWHQPFAKGAQGKETFRRSSVSNTKSGQRLGRSSQYEALPDIASKPQVENRRRGRKADRVRLGQCPLVGQR